MTDFIGETKQFHGTCMKETHISTHMYLCSKNITKCFRFWVKSLTEKKNCSIFFQLSIFFIRHGSHYLKLLLVKSEPGTLCSRRFHRASLLSSLILDKSERTSKPLKYNGSPYFKDFTANWIMRQFFCLLRIFIDRIRKENAAVK